MKIENTGGFVPFRVEIETKEDYELFQKLLNSAEFGVVSRYKYNGEEVHRLIVKLKRCGN